MRALVISGGGAKGAYAGGVAEYLIKEQGLQYDLFGGSSTGALLAPMLAAGEIDRAREVYTNVGQHDIFSSHPFIIKKQKGIYKTRINHFGVIKMFMRGKKTFGETHALRQLIKRTFTEEHYNRVKDTPQRVVVAVSNFSCNVVEHKYLADCSYDDFIDWIWISANFIPFMSLVVKDGQEYADGGFGNFIPIVEAIDAGATEIDVIILTPRRKKIKKLPSANAFSLLMNALDFMLSQIARDEKYIGLLESMHHDIKIRYFHTPRVLTDNSLIFDPEQMRLWWEEGKAFAKKQVEESMPSTF
ncbi:MAG: patatin-like phospholipase family protein [Saprospiraceae bacterium]|nr:patatin-like phospholipase family protein [Saprospiraceae bacterium]